MTETIHVLVLDDGSNDFEEIQRLLHTEPQASTRYYIESLNDYREMLTAMVRNTHDVYIVSHRVPGSQISGIELVERANAGGCSTPAILLTGLKDEDVEWAADEVGAAGFLNRSLDLTERTLKHAIRYAVRHFSQLQAIQGQLRTVQAHLSEVGRQLKRR